VKNQRDYCHDEKDVNQPARNVKDAETQQPRHEQHDKENSENTHVSPPHFMLCRVASTVKWSAQGIQVTKELDVSV
jgi:hypothetical protein